MTTQTNAIELYYWPTPNGWKITIMLEELGVPYNVNYINIGKGEQFEPAFLAISPNNRMPAIVDPEGPGGAPIPVFESGAILQYLGRKFGKFYPADERGRVEVDQWLFWQMGGLGPMLGQAHHLRRFAPETIPYAVDRYTNETARLYGVLDRQVAATGWLAAGEHDDRLFLQVALHLVEPDVGADDLLGEFAVVARQRGDRVVDQALGKAAHLGDAGGKLLEFLVERFDDVFGHESASPWALPSRTGR